MQILCTDIYQKQLYTILNNFSKENLQTTKAFKMYLETIIINIPTKVQKYKKSTLFDNNNIKDIEHRGFRIPFYYDQEKDIFLILGIVKL